MLHCAHQRPCPEPACHLAAAVRDLLSCWSAPAQELRCANNSAGPLAESVTHHHHCSARSAGASLPSQVSCCTALLNRLRNMFCLDVVMPCGRRSALRWERAGLCAPGACPEAACKSVLTAVHLTLALHGVRRTVGHREPCMSTHSALPVDMHAHGSALSVDVHGPATALEPCCVTCCTSGNTCGRQSWA